MSDTVLPRLRVVCRLSGGSNDKPRPEWFSKRLCVDSLLSAAEELRRANTVVELWLAVDVRSDIDAQAVRARYGRHFDRILPIAGGSAAKSWRATLNLPGLVEGADLVYFVEDDHLHRPDALVRLVHGDAAYRFAYSSDEDLAPHRATVRDGWSTVGSGVTSFAVMTAVLRKDLRLHRCMSRSGRGWDEVTFRALGGGAPEALGSGIRYVASPMADPASRTMMGFIGGIRHSLFRAFAILAGQAHKRVISGLTPPAATHAEPALLASGTDWAAVADAVASRKQEG